MADQILPKGVRLFNKHQNAPDFVIGSLIIVPNELVAWLKDQPELMTDYNGTKQVKLQILRSAAGNLYAAVDQFKATGSQAKAEPAVELPETGDLPF